MSQKKYSCPQENKRSLLFDAAYSNDIKSVRILLDQGIEPDCSSNDITPLWMATQKGLYEIAEMLLLKGAKVNFANASGETILWKAAEKGHPQIVSLLLRHRAAKNTLCLQVSALWIAVQNAHLETVQALLLAGCDVNLPNQETQRTPLAVAACLGKASLVIELIKHKADIDKEDSLGLTALCLAVRSEYVDIVDILLSAGARVDVITKNGKTLLYFAHENDNDLIVKKIIDAGCISPDYSHFWLAKQFIKYLDIVSSLFPDQYQEEDINTIKYVIDLGLCRGFSLLLISISEVLWEDFYSSLKRIALWDGTCNELHNNRQLGMDLETTLGHLLWLHDRHNIFSFGEEAKSSDLINLIKAPNAHKEEIFNFGFLLSSAEIIMILNRLLLPGKQVNICSLNPFKHSVILMKNSAGKYLILDNNASIGPVQKSYIEDVVFTLRLMFGSQNPKELLGLYFLVFGNIGSVEKVQYEQIKVDILSVMIHKRLVSSELAVEKTAKISSLACAVFANDEVTAFRLIDSGMVDDNIETIGWSIYVAAQKGNVRILSKLGNITTNFDWENNGETPLFIAACNGRTEAIKFLITRGVNLNRALVRDKGTPLLVSAQNGHLSSLVALVELGGADIEQCDIDGRSPLTIACQNRRIGIVDYLASRGAKLNNGLIFSIVDGYLNIIEILVSHGGSLTTPLSFFLLRDGANSTAKLQAPLNTPSNSTALTSYTLTPLQLAKFVSKSNVANYIQNELKKQASVKAIAALSSEATSDKSASAEELLKETPKQASAQPLQKDLIQPLTEASTKEAPPKPRRNATLFRPRACTPLVDTKPSIASLM